MQLNLFSLPILLGIGLMIMLMVQVYRRNRGRVVSIFMLFASLVIIYSLLFVTQLLLKNTSLQVFAFHLMVFFAMFIPMAVLFFTMEYLGYDTWINWKSLTILLLFPAVAGFLELTNPLHGLFWEQVEVVSRYGFTYVHETPGLFPSLISIYLYFIVGFSLAILFWGILQTPKYRRTELNILVIAMLIPILLDLTRILHLNPWPYLYITPYGILISVLLLGISIVKFNFLNVIPAAYNRLFTEVADAILVFDHKQNLLDYNTAAGMLINGDREASLTAPAELPEIMRTAFSQREVELKLMIGSTEQYFDVHYSELIESNGVLRSVVVTIHNITWRKQAEIQLQQLIKEKEGLLREINHRVKNNFNLAGSLLFLEAQKFNDPEVRAAFEVSRDRLRTMSLLNERLYRTEEFDNLDLGAYLTAIAEDLISVQAPRDLQIDLQFEVEEIFVGPREAIPCGLIINELVTNSLKHAFKNTDVATPTLLVKLQRTQDGLIHLQVVDNGRGYPAAFDPETIQTLGMKLVLMLGRDQLGGTTNLESDGGASFSLSFFPEPDDE